MINSSLIKDAEVRKAIDDINNRLKRIEEIPQVPSTTTLEGLIRIINRMTNNVKRNR